MTNKNITEEEWQLIQTIRNYRKAYPNGAKMFKIEIQELLNDLMDFDYKEETEEEESQEED